MGGGGLDGDSLLALQLHEVHGGAYRVRTFHLVDGPNFASIEEHPLGEGGLARIDVGRNTDIPDFGEVVDNAEGHVESRGQSPPRLPEDGV
jgi:hypothetical protein